MLMALAIITFLGVLIIWAIQRMTREARLPISVGRFRSAAYLLSTSALVFLIALAITMGEPDDVVFGLTPGLEIALTMPYLIMVLSLISLVLYLPLIREPAISKLSSAGYALVTLSGVGFVWLLMYWHFI